MPDIFDTVPEELSASMLKATSTDPETHAKVLDLSKRLNLPPEVVAVNPAWAQHQADNQIDAQGLTSRYPATAKFLSDPNRAAVSRDEIIQHMAFEDTIRNSELINQPGLFGKDVRDTLVSQLREKGHQIDLVEGPDAPVEQPFKMDPIESDLGMVSGGSNTSAPQAATTPEQQSQQQDDKAVRLLQTPQGFFERMITGAKNLEPVPYAGAVVEGLDIYELTQLANRVKDGTADEKDWIQLLKYDNEIRRGTDFGGKVAAVLVNIPAFAGELLTTGGVYTAGAAGARKAGLYAAKKILNKSARDVAESAILRGSVKAAGWVAGSIVQGAVAMPHRVAVDTMRRLMPQLGSMSVNDQGEIEKTVTDPEDGFATALTKAIVSQGIEVGTERAGGFIGKVTGLEALKSAVMTKWFKLHPTSGWSQFQALLRKAKWDGVLEEFGEERLGELLRAASGLEKLKLDPEQYAVELVSFAALPMAGAALYGPSMVRQSRQAAARAEQQVEFFRDLGEQASQSKTRTRAPGMLGVLGDMAAQEGPVERVFAPIAAWDQYFTSKGIDPRQAAQDTLGTTESYDKAREAGHDLEIPLGAYVEKLAPTEHNEPLSQVMRLGSADAPNAVEMRAGMQATEARVAEMLQLNQDYSALTSEQQTLTTELATLQEQVQAAQAQAEQRAARVQQIQAQLQEQAPQAMQEILAGNAPAAAELQGLVQEYQSLTAQDQQAQQATQRIGEIEARQQEITKEISRIEKRNTEARQSAPGQAPEVVDMAGEVYNQLMATGNTSDRVARAHSNMFARMAYIMANRAGMSLQQFKDRFVTQIVGADTKAPAGVTLSQEEQQRDADYLAAVEAGDMETAQRLVDEAAKAAGYTIGPVYHGTHETGITVFEPGRASAMYFTDDVNYASDYGDNLHRVFLRGNVGDLTDPQSDAYKLAVETFNANGGWSSNDDAMEGRESPDFNPATDNTWEILDNPDTDIGAALIDAGYDVLKLQERGAREGEPEITSYAVFSPAQIKSAEPVTRDADGNVIPLSERFNPEQDSILYQKAPRANPLDLAPAEYIDGRGTVSTRQPTAVNAPESEKVLQVDLEAINATKTLKENIAEDLRGGIERKGSSARYITNKEAEGSDDEVIRAFIDLVKGNLRWLWNKFPAAYRDRAKLWYVGANKIAEASAEHYDITPEQAAGVFAVLSPQKDWFQNVSMGERVMYIWNRAKTEDFVFTEELFNYCVNNEIEDVEGQAQKEFVPKRFKPKRWNKRSKVSEEQFNAEEAKRRKEHNKAERERKAEFLKKQGSAKQALEQKQQKWNLLREKMLGKRWSELSFDGRARLFRALDETTNDRSYRIILPEGGRGEIARTSKGEPAVVAWSSYNFIAKALSVLENGSIENISMNLGKEHKVRNFFNNISDPQNAKGYVTIDTHAVAAGVLNALSGTSEEVKDNFGAAGRDSLVGIGGTYGVYAEAYKELADELTKEMGTQVLAREVQSVTWEAVRLLFTKEQKTSGELTKKLDALWNDYAEGKRTLDDVRGSIWDLSGGIQPPSWADTRFGFDAQQSGVAGDVYDGGPFIPLGRRAASVDTGLSARRGAGVRRGVVRGSEAAEEVTLNQSVFPEPQRTPLLAIHNISGANILNAAKLGGLPVPSIGVTRPDAIYTGFGEISLIGTKDLADPRRNPVFNADAYTVRFPQPEYGKMKQAAANKIIKPLLPFQKLFNDHTPSEVWQRLVDRGDVASAIDKLSRSEAAKAAFLKSKGITVEPVMREPGMYYGWSNSDTLKNYLTPERMKQAMAGDEDIRRELVPVVEAAIREDVQKKGLEQEEADYLIKRFKNSALSTDGGVGFNLLHRIEQDWNRAGQKEVDLGPTRDALDEALKGREAEFEQWVQGMILAEAGEPKVTIGRKKVPFTLENIVDYMTSSSVKGVESTMTFGEGKARAMSAVKLGSVDEMRNYAEWQIGTKEEVDAAREKASKLLNEYRQKAAEHYGYSDTWSAFDDSMKALARWAKGARTTANLQKALKAQGFKSVPEDVLELGVEAGKAFLNAPVPYFESKPQRSVSLSEFKAAVVPSDTRQEVRQVLADAGVPVFEYTPYDDPSRRAAVAQASQETQTLFQKENDARGSISFNPAQRGAPRREFTVRMLKKANASTFMHEAAHFYLEVFNDLASAPDAPQALTEDWGKISKWLGLQAGVPVTTEQHETFARGFERYLMEGKAPAEEVRGFFASMRTWLVRIYRDLLNLNVDISDEIRGVFDRMVATDVEIQAAQAREKVEPMFGTKPEGMEDAAWERYRKAVENASLEARERLQTELQKEMVKAQSAERKAEIERVTKQVTEELGSTREHIALSLLRAGKMPDDRKIPASLMPIKLDKASLLSAGLDDDTLDSLRRLGVYRVQSDGHITLSVDMAAEVLGFGSADELVQALLTTRPFHQAVKEETMRRVDASHPSMMEDSEQIKSAASEAVRNEYRDDVIAFEAQELQRLIKLDREATGRVADLAPPPLGAIARKILRSGTEQANAARVLLDNSKLTVDFIKQIALKAAQEQLAGMRLRDIRPSLYLAAARNAGARASRLATAGDFQGALGQKEAELLNHILYRESRAMQKDAQKQQRYLQRMSEDAARERLGKASPSYREQVDGILERFNFVPIPLTQVDRRARFADWITAQEAKGFTVDVDPAVRDEAFRKDFREMTAIELTGVYEAVKQIDHLAKLHSKLLTLQDERDFRAVVQDLVAQITANTKAKPRTMGSKTAGEKVAEGWDSFFAAHRKLASLIREIDGFVDQGPLYKAIMAPINAAGDAEAVETEKATEAIQKLFKVFSKDDLKGMTRKHVVRGATKNFNLSREDRLAIALNWGNEDNRQKLVDGYNGLNEQDVLAIIDTLEEKDWKFVQSVWDYIDSFWPRIRDKQERVYGLPPGKIEPTPVVTKFGVFRGGYYPLRYAGARAEGESDADAAKMMMRGALTASTTRRGHTKERVANLERPVRLDLGVLTEHITQVVHDLTHHEMLIDVNRLLRNRGIMDSMEEHYGEPVYRQFRKALEAIAVGNTTSEDRFTRALGHIRAGASVAGLGFNLMTSMMQAFGLTNAIPRVGSVNMAKAVGRWIGSRSDMEDSIAWIYERSDMMRLRGKTMNRELNEIRNTVDPKFQTALMDSYFYLIQKGQMLADVPTWLGAYHKAMDANMSEAEAIQVADQTVIDTQGGGMVKDLATVQRGGPLLKMWTTFYSYFNALWNMNAETVKRTNFKSPADMGRMMVDLLILNSLPVALQYALVTALRGGAGDDDEEWYKALAKQQMSYMLAQLVFVREMGGIMDGRNYEGPAGARFFAESYKLARQVEQGEADRGFWVAANKVGGMLFHYPAVQLQRTVEGMKSLWEGRTGNPAVLIVGPSKEER